MEMNLSVIYFKWRECDGGPHSDLIISTTAMFTSKCETYGLQEGEIENVFSNL